MVRQLLFIVLFTRDLSRLLNRDCECDGVVIEYIRGICYDGNYNTYDYAGIFIYNSYDLKKTCNFVNMC